MEAARELVAAGTDVNAKDSGGRTALELAEENGHAEIAELLRAAGAVNGKREQSGNGEGQYVSLLMVAARYSNSEMVKAQLAAGADVNAKDNDGMTALMHAVAGKAHFEVIQVLLAAGSDVNAEDDEGKTAFDWAKENGHAEIAERLREVAKKARKG